MVAASSAAATGSAAAATSKSTTVVVPPSVPLARGVARPVVNLGSTCYMNAVLQALAHAPELCLAMDVEPHHVTCPIAAENRKRRISSSPTSSPEGAAVGATGEQQTENDFRRNNAKQLPAATRKLRRSSRKSPNTVGQSANNNTDKNNDDDNNSNNDDNDQKYCALCEMEWHLQEVHAQSQSSTTNNNTSKDKPVAPSFFVHGFIDHVAPWFKLGQQEDSHEFLRLLIDAMQRSCKNARPKTDDAMEEDIPPIGEDGTSPPASTSAIDDSKDVEYPFQLFRGTVASVVTCGSCGATSSTLDPIEDVGLEVTTSNSSSSSPGGLSTRGSGGGGDSSNTSGSEALADVTSAFQRFARVEALDTSYKCEKCGQVGRATKQSRLASIPPILTLHLKRFRYGADGRPSHPALTSNSRRSTKSGSAKIEGHIKFEQVFNLQPYLTDKLQQKQKAMFCRLFAVIVHAGKNSHSGHYVAYVRSVSNKDWWKMDDARVTMVDLDEVLQAEAYMLFYRVLDHPFAVKLEDRAKKMREEREEILARLAAEAKAQQEEAAAKQKVKEEAAEPKTTSTTAAAAETEKENVPAAENKKAPHSPAASKTNNKTAAAATDSKVKQESSSKPATTTSSATSTAKTTPPPSSSQAGGGAASSSSNNNNRKRGLPAYTDGKSWAKANTRLKPNQYSSLRSAEEYINENVQFKPDFFKRINEEGSKPNAKVDQCPIKRITGDDVVGGYSKFSLGLKKTLHRIAQRYEEENGESLFTAPVVSAAAASQTEATAKSNLLDKFVAVGGAASQDDLL